MPYSPTTPRAILPLILLSSILLALILNLAHHGAHSSAPILVNSHDTTPTTLIVEVLSKIAVPFGSNSTREVHFTSSYDSSTELKKRVLTWQEALDGGRDSLTLLDGARQQPSSWNRYEQLAVSFHLSSGSMENGWTVDDEIPEEDIGGVTDDYNEPEGPYDSLNISPAKAYEIRVDQDQEFNNCHRKDNDATRAFFSNIYNGPDSAIVAETNIGALQKLIKDGRDGPHPDGGDVNTRLPDLRRWSDITWLLWAHHATDARKGLLKYVFRHNVVTASTRDIMEQAAGVGRRRLDSDWPGIKLDRGGEKFQALLGTPHGKGVVFLIVDHADLATKNIESVTLFTTDEGEDYHLLFTLTG
ncbi:MAG: hypothetical protein Q9168_004500 [Polycauliona sp. 1 TL-2023]